MLDYCDEQLKYYMGTLELKCMVYLSQVTVCAVDILPPQILPRSVQGLECGGIKNENFTILNKILEYKCPSVAYPLHNFYENFGIMESFTWGQGSTLKIWGDLLKL